MGIHITEKVWFHLTDDNRFFLHFWNKCFSFEWRILSAQCDSLQVTFGLNHDSESTVRFCIAVPLLLTFYLSLDLGYYKILERICGKYKERAYGFYICSESFKLYFHENPTEWPSGFQYYQEWERIFKGKRDSHFIELYSKKVPILIPAGYDYEEERHIVTVKKMRQVVTFPRWRNQSFIRYEVECKEGVKHPGKGTAAHNCGEDATYSVTFGAGMVNSHEEAAQEFVKDCLKTRKTYPL